jgi:cytochrome b
MSRRAAVEGTVVAWDWPARITHWGFSFSLTAALVLGFQFDPESPWFRWHIPAAYFAVWFLGVRLLLGFAGSRYLRWTAFFHSPRNTVRYFGSVFRGERDTAVGLNPGSAAFASGIYACLAALIYSGFEGDLVETWHGRLARAAVGLIGLHLVGLLLHALRHRAPTPLAMVHGRVAGRPPEGLAGTHARAGLLLLLLSGLVLALLVGCYDEANGVIAIPGLPEIPVPAIQKG